MLCLQYYAVCSTHSLDLNYLTVQYYQSSTAPFLWGRYNIFFVKSVINYCTNVQQTQCCQGKGQDTCTRLAHIVTFRLKKCRKLVTWVVNPKRIPTTSRLRNFVPPPFSCMSEPRANLVYSNAGGTRSSRHPETGRERVFMVLSSRSCSVSPLFAVFWSRIGILYSSQMASPSLARCARARMYNTHLIL